MTEDIGSAVIASYEIIGEHYAACTTQIMELKVVTWDPSNFKSLPNVLTSVSGIKLHEGIIDYFKPLEEATSLTLESFTEIFQDPETEACISTPMELWPGP